MALGSLGWNDRWQALFEGFRRRGLRPARVVADGLDPVTVCSDQGEGPAVMAGRLDDAGEPGPPAIGDWVALDTAADTAVIRGILPRSSVIARRRPGTKEGAQLLAANVDRMLLVESLDRGPNPRRIERGVALAWDGGATPAVVLTKADVCSDLAEADELARQGAPMSDVVVVSAAADTGVDALDELLGPGLTGVLLGPSGAGKSTLINRLLGEERLATGAVREGDRKGRHTTTRRQLVPLPSGACLIDTPGVRELGLWLDAEAVDAAFPDLEAHAAGCRFRDCRHDNEPGCAVRAAVEAGEIAAERLAGYHRLRREAEAHELRSNTHEARARDRRFGRLIRRELRRKGVK